MGDEKRQETGLWSPRDLPNYLTALFTLILATFAIAAWLEVRRGSEALEAHLAGVRP